MLRRIVVLAAVVASAVLSGCSCGEPAPAVGASCTPGTVLIEAPQDFTSTGQRVTVDDDPAAPGVQTAVRAAASGVPAGTAFTVIVNGTPLGEPVPLGDDGRFSVEGVTFANGNNALSVQGTQCDQPVSDTITVVVDAGSGGCAFTDPLDGQTLGAELDLDFSTQGLQYDVEATCADAESGADARLLANGVEIGTATFLPDGDLRFPGVTLPEGAVTLELASAAGSARVEVQVDLEVPELLLAVPVGVSLETDLDGDASNGLQATARVTGTAVGDGDSVEVDCGAGIAGSGVVAGVEAQVVLTFTPQGCFGEDFSCIARLPAQPGVSSNVATIHADDEAPALEIVTPASVRVCTATPGVAVAVECLEAGELVSLQVEEGDRLETIADPVEVDGGLASWSEGDIRAGALSEGDQTLLVTARDATGNVAELRIPVRVDTTVPAPAFRVPADGATLDGGDDANGDLSDGFQLDVQVQVAGEADGVVATLTVEVAGTTVAGPYFADVAAGVAHVGAVDLPNGAQELVVSVDDACNAAGVARIGITVATGQSQCNLVLPPNGFVTGTADVAVEVQTDLPVGTQLAIAGTDPAGNTVTFDTFVSTGPTTTGAAALGAGDGVYSIHADCGGGAGRSVDKQVEVDTAAPVLAVAVPASQGNFIGQSAFDADPRPGFQVEVVVTADAIQDGSAGTVDVSCTDGATDSVPLAFAAGAASAAATVSDGATCTFTANATDAAGNAAAPVSLDRTVDLVAPTVFGCTPSSGTIVSSPVTVTCSVAGGTTGDAWVVTAGGGGLARGTHGAAPPTLAPLPLAVTDGPHNVSVAVTDAAGNAAPLPVTFVVDSAAPTITIDTPPSGGTVNVLSDFVAGTPEIDVQLRIGVTGVNAGTRFYLCSAAGAGGAGPAAAGGGNELAAAPVTTVSGNPTTYVIPFPDGSYDVVAYVEDEAGNGATSPPWSITVDSVPPQVTAIRLAADANGDGVLNAAELAAGGGRVRAVVDVTGADGRVLTLTSGAASTTGTVAGGTTPALSLALGAGVHTLTATVTDANGNPNLRAAAPVIANPEAVRSVEVDTTAPTVSFVIPTGAFVTQNPVPLTVSTDAAGAAVELFVDGASVGTTTAAQDGRATVSWAAPADGTYTFLAEVRDAAGNVGTATVVSTLDTAAPVLVFEAPTAGQTFNAGPVAVSVRVTGAPDGTMVTVTSSSTPGSFTAPVAGGVATFSLSLLDAPGQTLTATASDEAGLVGQTTSGAFTVDTVGCSLALTLPTSNPKDYVAADDVDGATPGLQTPVAFGSDCDGRQVSLTVDGGAPQSATVAGGSAGFTITLADGAVDVPVVATIDDGAGNVTSVTLIASTDLSPGSFTQATPAGDFALVSPTHPGIDGTSILGDASAGLPATTSFSFTVAGAVGGSLELLVDGVAVGAPVAITAEGQVVPFAAVVLAQGRVNDVTARLLDAGGNVTTRPVLADVAVLAPGDLLPAVTVTDRRAASIRADFTAPGGDGAAGGLVASYDLRWSFDPVAVAGNDAQTLANFLAALPLAAPAPAAAGTPQQATFTAAPLGTYHVCGRALDPLGNVGAITCGLATSGWTTTTYESGVAGALFGFHVVALGDVDGDGDEEIAVTERGRSSNAGAVHVYFGGPNLGTLGSTMIVGAGAERCGEHLAAGDLDGDGRKDLIVGCNSYQSSRGRVMVYFADAAGYDAARKVELRGTFGVAAQFGRAVESVGDVDGDGIEDLFVAAYLEGAAGTGYLYLGRSQAQWAADAANAEGDGAFVATSTALGARGRTFVGETNGDRFGFRYGATTLGDLDGDGSGDLGLPASAVRKFHLFDGGVVEGAVGVTLNPTANGIRTMTEPGLNPSSALNAYGQDAVGGVDVTGDGFPDLLVSDGTNKRVYLYRGLPATQDIDSVAAQTLLEGTTENFGWMLRVEDVTGDGLKDLLVGTNATNGPYFAVYRNDGTATPFAGRSAKVGGVGFHGVGLAVADLDGDGDREVIAGAPLDGNGKVYIYAP